MPIPLIAAGIGAIGSVAGSGIASHQQSKATQGQLGAINQARVPITNAYNTGQQALGTAYQTQQANLSPYQQLGQQALGALGGRMGIAPPGTVQIKAPNGQIYHVPQGQAQQALAAGGTAVQ